VDSPSMKRVKGMDEAKNIQKIREQLYEDVWAEPMISVAQKNNLSDNGVRKRCKSLNIPLPPFGYWAKKKAGKAVTKRPPLPPYNEIILNDCQDDGKELSENHSNTNAGSLVLRDLDNMQLDQLSTLHGLDLIVPDCMAYFNNWLDSIVVPSRMNNYDNLISMHKSELEYREARDKAYPFRDEHIKLYSYRDRINERDDISALPIEVSSNQLNRSYRIVDTLIKTLRKLKANFSVENNGKDNIRISLLSSTVYFEVSESKTKRRHLVNPSNSQDFRPLYEEVYDGNLLIKWQISKYAYYSSSNKEPTVDLEYCDCKDYSLENQISLMILEVYKQCCENELIHAIENKKWQLEREREEKDRQIKEYAQKQAKLEERTLAQKRSIINGILEQSNNWFKHEHLTRYADELDKYLATCSDTEAALLRSYILLVRETANKLNPVSDILETMRIIESKPG